MSKSTVLPPLVVVPTTITHASFVHLHSLYPTVVKRVYEGKIKDAKKLVQALDDDAWRYGGLVKVVHGRRGKGDAAAAGGGGGGGWLEKAELERLVRWKM